MKIKFLLLLSLALILTTTLLVAETRTITISSLSDKKTYTLLKSNDDSLKVVTPSSISPFGYFTISSNSSFQIADPTVACIVDSGASTSTTSIAANNNSWLGNWLDGTFKEFVIIKPINEGTTTLLWESPSEQATITIHVIE